MGEEAQVAKVVDLAHVESVDEGGASFRLFLSSQKGVDSRERSLCSVLVGSRGFFPIIEDQESSQGGSNAVATERRDGRDGGTVAALELFPVASKMIERSCEGVHFDSTVLLEDSWVAITDKALLAEANQHRGLDTSLLDFYGLTLIHLTSPLSQVVQTVYV